MTSVWLRRLDAWIFARCCALLPSWFREQAAHDMRTTHAARAGEQRDGLRFAAFMVGEASSILLLAARLHFPDSNREKRLPILDSLWQDVAFAVRAYARRPGSTLLVVLTFALGVGAATAMYSVVDAVLVRPLAVRDADRIASIYPTYPSWRGNERLAISWQHGAFTWPAYIAYQNTQRSFTSVAGYTWSSATLVGTAEPERIETGLATPELFTVLETRPLLGRVFAPDDTRDVALLTYPFWVSHFAADAGVLGRKIKLGTRQTTIIGVLPREFEMSRFWGVTSVIHAAVWRPLISDGSEQFGPQNGFLTVIGRLRNEVGIAAADAEAATLIHHSMSRPDFDVSGRVVSRIEDQSAGFREALLILVGASALLLIAACVSVAAMLLGAGMDREGELSVRASLGAGRSRLVRQLTTEGVLLGVTGGAIGVGLSVGLLKVFVLLAPASMPGLANASINPRVLGVALAISVTFALLFTLVPAIVLSHVRLAGGVSARVTRGGHGALQQTLIVGELVLATMLLLAAGLLTRTMNRLQSVDPGFQPDGLLTVRVAPAAARVSSTGSADIASPYYAQLADALRRLPGVQQVAIAGVLPFSGDAGSNDIQPEGYVGKPGEEIAADRRPVSPNYFDVMKMSVVAGRGFTSFDDQSDAAPVVVVNQALARKFWPHESAVGKRLGYWNRQATIVGVVRDTREAELRGEQGSKYYLPAKQVGDESGSFVIRTAGDPSSLAPLIRPALWAVDPQLPVTQVATMRERMGETLLEQRYRTRLMSAFSVLAALFAITGVYGVLNRAVARRRHELGVRTALGASRRDIAMLVLGQGVRLGVTGVVLGLVGGSFGTRVLESMLYETTRNDPLTIAGIGAIVLGLTLAAAWQPARRAASVEPMQVLRGD